MGENTDIEWTDYTWGPWEGCTKVSAGCANCYAATRNHRFGNDNWGHGKPRRLTADWTKPTRWNKAATSHWPAVQFRRPRVFPSLCDPFDDEVPIEWLARFLALIAHTPNLTWLLLTKRPENWEKRIIAASLNMRRENESGAVYWREWAHGHAPSNVWIGASVEDQPNADRRIPELLKIPANLRFLSLEPLLGPVDLAYTCFNGSDSFGSMPGIGWVIGGGESGHGARPCNVAWIRDIVRQCAAASVPCFVKQLGSNAVHEVRFNEMGDTEDERMRLLHPKGGDPAEWPEDLRVRQFPEVGP